MCHWSNLSQKRTFGSIANISVELLTIMGHLTFIPFLHKVKYVCNKVAGPKFVGGSVLSVCWIMEAIMLFDFFDNLKNIS